MGQLYCCQNLCGENKSELECPEVNTNDESDEPPPSFARKVKQHIELHPKIKETYILYRTPHTPQKKGVKLSLYYLFEFAAYYEGDWKNGLPHGFGRIIYDDGSLYEGCFRNGVAECHQALFIKDDGSFYRGNIKQNQATGYGELSTPKLFYKGYWINDLPNGKARQIYSSISFYQGQFVKGLKEGKGIYQWNANEYYIGNFSQNKLDGTGDLITKDYTYKGKFKDGKKEGEGIYIDNLHQFKFKGSFQNNVPSGPGEITFEDGTVFTGEFQNFQNRKGTLKLTSGQTIQIDTTARGEMVSDSSKSAESHRQIVNHIC